MKTIKKTIVIHASNQKVWNVLTSPQYYKQWMAEFSSTSNPQTTWEQGSKAIFVDASGRGMVAKITENKHNQLLAMEYTGIMVDGKEDHESDEAKKYIGGKEIYAISQKNDSTQLDIASDMSEEMIDELSLQWDAALEKVKELAEK